MKKIQSNSIAHDEAVKRLKEAKTGYRLAKGENYTSAKSRNIFLCENCGETFSARFKDVLAKTHKCPHCTEKEIRIPRGCTEEEFRDLINEKVKNEGFKFKYVSGYINSRSKVTFKCIKCKGKFERIAKDFLRPRSAKMCPLCEGTMRGKHFIKENYLENILKNAIDGKDYQWIDKYSGNNKDLHTIFHIACGRKSLMRPNDFQQGTRCQLCIKNKESSITKIFERYMELNYPDIKIFKEKKFVIGHKKYHYDYYIPCFNNLILELDGHQHFNYLREIKNQKAMNDANMSHIVDVIKNQVFVNSKGMDYIFIRIPYIRFYKNIDKIVDSLVEKKGLLDKEFCEKYNLYYIRYGKRIFCRNYYNGVKDFYNQ